MAGGSFGANLILPEGTLGSPPPGDVNAGRDGHTSQAFNRPISAALTKRSGIAGRGRRTTAGLALAIGRAAVKDDAADRATGRNPVP
jgi:hypothetical protein